MIALSDKQANDLVDISIGLSKIVDKISIYYTLSEHAFMRLEKANNIADYMEKAKQFLYILKINEMVEEITKKYGSSEREIPKP